MQQQTELSLFFQTLEPNGLLLYAGPKGSTSAVIRRRRQALMPLVNTHQLMNVQKPDTLLYIAK